MPDFKHFNKDEIIKLHTALLTMPSRSAFDGYDDKGSEVAVKVFFLKLLLQDGRVYVHPEMGSEEKVRSLEQKVRAKGEVNLSYWHLSREKQQY